MHIYIIKRDTVLVIKIFKLEIIKDGKKSIKKKKY